MNDIRFCPICNGSVEAGGDDNCTCNRDVPKQKIYTCDDEYAREHCSGECDLCNYWKIIDE